MLWLVPLFPQLYENHRTKRCEGLSFYFMLFWLIGDSCNLIGASLTHQQPLQKIIGVYYIAQDLVLFGQFIYYTRFYHANRRMLVSRRDEIVNLCLFCREDDGWLHYRGAGVSLWLFRLHVIHA